MDRLEGAPFAPLLADTVELDWSGFDPSAFDEALVELASRVWQERTHSEYRSVLIMNRFLAEVAEAGLPLDVLHWAADLIGDEVRHTELCRQATLALGAVPTAPDPAPPPSETYRSAPARDRATTTGLSMLAISETLSAGFIADLAERCDTPGLSAVLRATIEEEAGHGELGWAFVQRQLALYPKRTWPSWRHLVRTTVEPHLKRARSALTGAEEADQDAAHVALGLFTPRRQAEVFARTYREHLQPRLQDLDLDPPTL